MKMRSIFAAALGMLMLSESAFALSCRQPDLVKTLEQAKASDKIYNILVGKFVPMIFLPKTPHSGNDILPIQQFPNMRYKLKPKPPHSGNNRVPIQQFPDQRFKPKPPVVTQTYFEGYSLAGNPRGDKLLTRFPVDIETSCAGPWCSSVPPADRELIAFVEVREGQAPRLKISPCPYWTFPAAPEKVQKVRQCLDKSCDIAGLH